MSADDLNLTDLDVVEDAPMPYSPDVALAETSRAVIVQHIPGFPLETQADADARIAKEGEPVADTLVNQHVAEYAAGEVDTTSPEANLASRSNIVWGGNY